ncbi:MAG: hypoxanthine phosphoribosyltransferase [Ignavibacteriales bacterium]|jgi:hypoxanthine phosphoribosyltransferase|nr:hypoxanthine phosphoribosyltransferase [Ignavibacteriaceae bacterium]NLH60681.1 hypoxanthine phosphoribosyltransferase [Ignavibacteriales bacterium]HOJ18532.1 hypoxanthine phosphoribosyltransferase [Ignavibacteriaceae bacterium]HPO55513.1 hypoxanthine phosphoribosyltransferase [Ignavibacteriaceae bacterium]
MEKILVGEDVFVPYLTEKTIQKRVAELALQLHHDYKDTTPVFIGILNGSFVFMSDLVKNYPGDCEIDFMKLSSYGEEKISSGQVRLLKELNCKIEDRHLIIVEDIVDTGLSIQFMENFMKLQKPASVKVVTLLLKPDSLKYNVKIDYIGFEIPSKFVIGYGLDYAQKYRNLKSIYCLSN